MMEPELQYPLPGISRCRWTPCWGTEERVGCGRRNPVSRMPAAAIGVLSGPIQSYESYVIAFS